MSQPYNLAGLKSYDAMSRFSSKNPDGNGQKAKPRYSEPPMYTPQAEFAAEQPKQIKDVGIHMNSFQNKLYRPYEARIEPPLRANLSSHINTNSQENITKIPISPFVEHRPSEYSTFSKLPQTGSPKLDTPEWLAGKYSQQNRTLPSSNFPPHTKIDKQAYLNKNENIKVSSPTHEPSTKKTAMYLHFYNNTYQSWPHNEPHYAATTTKTYVDPSSTRKAPRHSYPIYQMNSEEDALSTFSTTASSPVQHHSKQIDIRLAHHRTEDEKPHARIPNSPYDQSVEGELFKKNKDLTQIAALNAQKTAPRRSGLCFSDFKVCKSLGSGKFGQVFLVRHKRINFVCAMKIVPKKVIREENIINQFIRYLKIQSFLNHPNIIKLYGFFDDKDNIYLLLELGSYGQLYKLIKNKKKFTYACCAFIIRQICEALKYLHGLNVLHRDIKPENIVMTLNVTKLCDFGWAVKGTDLRSTFCGTPLYVSPYILKGQQYDEKIDVWSVGILTYELLIGDIPFYINTDQYLIKIVIRSLKQIKDDIVFPESMQISNDAKDFVLKILNKNPDERLKVEKLLEHSFLKKASEYIDFYI